MKRLLLVIEKLIKRANDKKATVRYPIKLETGPIWLSVKPGDAQADVFRRTVVACSRGNLTNLADFLWEGINGLRSDLDAKQVEALANKEEIERLNAEISSLKVRKSEARG